jgi:hypothetical protein
VDTLSVAIEKINSTVAARGAEYRADRDTIRPQLMVEQPWRIRRAIDGLSWRETSETYPELLIRCRSQIAKAKTLRASGHHAFSANGLLALREAEAALEILTGAAVLTGEAA